MKSLVLEIQALAQSGTTEVTELLRRAKVVAVKLNLKEPLTWIDRELGGYEKDAEIPAYRCVPSRLIGLNPFHGPIPVQFEHNDWVYEHFCTAKLTQPIGEIGALALGKGKELHSPLRPPEIQLLRDLGVDTDLPMVRSMAKTPVVAILDAVRNHVLGWSLELEQQGILGEGMSFTSDEKQKAQTAATVTHLNFGPVIHGDHANVASSASGPATTAANSQVGAIAGGTGAAASGEVHQAQVTDLDEVRRLVEVMLADLKNVPAAQRGDLVDHGEDLRDEVRKAAPKNSKVKAALSAMKTGLPLIITWAPKAVETYEKIKHLLGL